MKLDRLMGILAIMLQNDRVTAPYLASTFEVSRRTISRDIDALCQAGIPIVTHQGAGGGISIADGFKLDKSVLTKAELSDIIAALRGIGSVSEQAHIRQILIKLGADASMHESIVIDLASHYKGHLTDKIKTIKQAIFDRRIIEFDYYNNKGESRRTIEPYNVVFQWTSWYVFGFCAQRQDWRMFKLNRLWNMRCTDAQFALRSIPPGKHDFDSHLPDNIKFAALFDKSVKYQLIETYGPDSFYEDDDGLYFERGYTNRDHIISWLLSFGDKVKIIGPPCLAAEIKSIAKKILLRYQT